MYIQVRTVDAKTKITLDISKTAKVQELKKLIESNLNISPDKQRLFFRGKQLEDEYSLFDYNINVNDVVQIMEKVSVSTADKQENTESKAGSSHDHTEPVDKSPFDDFLGEPVENSCYFKVGEYVDARDTTYGAWFEGKINKIYEDKNYEQNKEMFKSDESSGWPHDGYFYEVAFEEDGKVACTIKTRLLDIRPRAQEKIQFEHLKAGDKVLANYNIEDPTKRGYWYDCTISNVKPGKNKNLTAEVNVGLTCLKDCKILFTDDVMRFGEIKPLSEREPNIDNEPTARQTEIPMSCEHCNNNERRKCRECGCHVCGLKTDENKQIMCDECDYAFHIWCLTPPLDKIPEVDDWYCHECKNDENEIVSAGGKLKESKKKAKMASKQNNTSRDWGKGMACVGRTKVCTIVPFDHFGPIPGVEVGTQWKFRMQASEAGVHRPHVAGIHGRENLGAFSIVLSGGYEDDVDKGDEVVYTGSGGRDLSGNKRTNAQGFDQKLSRLNKAIALNCNVPLNQKGAEAKNWRGGKPVRVIRNYKLAKHSKFAPAEGNRYDGIYKVVKYYPEKGQSGFTVWRFVFRRDDPVPAPWTKEGKERIETLGLEMQYPEGYLEALESKEKVKDTDEDPEMPKSKGKKRILEESPNSQPKAATKKVKVVKFSLEDDVLLGIQKDTENEKLWEECKEETCFGKPKFIAKVEESFTCICCTELVYKPITTPCLHNFCSACLKRSFQAEVTTCPTCRSPLDKEILKKINSALQDALLQLFPGYTGSR
uniref:RING-type E3 ubiquitin transferase n=1 Tax=Graphocephala atropunctata TaxID=36148 RepID=A0A1B6LJB4_9HEMI